MKLSATATFTRGPALSGGLLSAMQEAGLRVTQRTAEHILQQAQVIVPIDTGALYNSGAVVPGTAAEGPTTDVEFTMDYAGFVEFGTVRQAAQPYLRPSMDAAHDVFVENAKAEIEGAIRGL